MYEKSLSELISQRNTTNKTPPAGHHLQRHHCKTPPRDTTSTTPSTRHLRWITAIKTPSAHHDILNYTSDSTANRAFAAMDQSLTRNTMAT